MAQLALSKTRDGYPAVRVRHLCFALATQRDVPGIFSLYPARRVEMTDLSEYHFDGNASHQAECSEAGMLAHAQRLEDHYAEVEKLNRRKVPNRHTPWGMSQDAEEYADGIVSVSTASHGGFLLSQEKNELIHPCWRNEAGAYEEDCCWAIVAFHFPALFTPYEKASVERTLKAWMTDEWETVTGITVSDAESPTRRAAKFREVHRNDWVVRSAVNSRNFPGMVEVTARVEATRKEAIFLVSSDEYASVPPTEFVADPTRHHTLEEAERLRHAELIAAQDNHEASTCPA